MYVIDHCEMVAKAKEEMDENDFQEAVIERAGEIIERTIRHKKSDKPHKFAAVEVAATAVALHVINEGASEIVDDFNLDLDNLKSHAASNHISGC